MAPTEIGGYNEEGAAALLAPISVSRLEAYLSRPQTSLTLKNFMLACQYSSVVLDTFFAYVRADSLATALDMH